MQKEQKVKRQWRKTNMSEITKIAVNRTMDPMQAVMNCLFEKRGDVFISNRILEHIKKVHSYTKISQGKEETYTFHKRIRGTDELFSFLVVTGPAGNRAYGLDCLIAEFGVVHKNANITESKMNPKVYVMLQEE